MNSETVLNTLLKPRHAISIALICCLLTQGNQIGQAQFAAGHYTLEKGQVFLKQNRVTTSHQHLEVIAKKSLPFTVVISSSSVLRVLGFIFMCFANTAFSLVPS